MKWIVGEGERERWTDRVCWNTVNDKNEVVLFDLELVTTTGRHTAIVGTKGYMAWEVEFGHGYDYRADLWSLAFVVFYMLGRVDGNLSEEAEEIVRKRTRWLAASRDPEKRTIAFGKPTDELNDSQDSGGSTSSLDEMWQEIEELTGGNGGKGRGELGV